MCVSVPLTEPRVRLSVSIVTILNFEAGFRGPNLTACVAYDMYSRSYMILYERRSRKSLLLTENTEKRYGLGILSRLTMRKVHTVHMLDQTNIVNTWCLLIISPSRGSRIVAAMA